MATSNRYEFQPPMNMNAIRSNIMQRIKQRNEYNRQPLTPPSSVASKHEIQYLHLDNGLPSPPIESCTFEEEQDDTFEMASSNNTLPDSPPSPVMSLSKSSSSCCSLSTTSFESSDAIREKIRLLKQEKHRLFQTMKDLLSQPAPAQASAPAPQPTMAVVAVAATTATTAASSTIEKPISKQTSAKPMVERSRSQSRDNSLKSRPIIRSRSISHTEFSRPISRYSYRSPPRFYGNDNRNYPYNRSSYPHTSLQQNQNASSSSSSPSLNMSRRVLNSNNINNNNNNNSSNNNISNSSYVSSRSQLAGRPSSSAAAASSVASASSSTSSTFRPLNRSSSDRHSRY